MKNWSLLFFVGIWVSGDRLWATDFQPRSGDEATYEVSLPQGQGLARRRLEAFDPQRNLFDVVVEQEVAGRVRTEHGRITLADLQKQYISDIQEFCRSHQGQLQETDFQGHRQTACLVVKDQGVFRQEDLWIAEVPFGLLSALKTSPLHPKAGTATRLLSFRRASSP